MPLPGADQEISGSLVKGLRRFCEKPIAARNPKLETSRITKSPMIRSGDEISASLQYAIFAVLRLVADATLGIIPIPDQSPNPY